MDARAGSRRRPRVPSRPSRSVRCGRFREFELDQGRVSIGRDASGDAGVIRTFEAPYERQPREPRFDFGDGGTEVRRARLFVPALDEDVLGRRFGEGRFERAVGRRRLADTGLVVVQRLGPEHAAEDERREHERDPSPDRGLAVPGAPASRPGGDVVPPAWSQSSLVASHPSVLLGLGSEVSRARFAPASNLPPGGGPNNAALRRLPLVRAPERDVGLTPPAGAGQAR
jgi:hypothetical protein